MSNDQPISVNAVQRSSITLQAVGEGQEWNAERTEKTDNTTDFFCLIRVNSLYPFFPRSIHAFSDGLLMKGNKTYAIYFND